MNGLISLKRGSEISSFSTEHLALFSSLVAS
jgi:hypothetical protein